MLNWIKQLIWGPKEPPVAKRQDIPYNDFVDWDGKCPDCGNEKFYEGPSGGLCVNIECSECGTWLNVSSLLGIAQRINK